MSKETCLQKNIISRLKPIISQLPNKEFRQSYISSHTKRFLAAQIKNLRGERTQKEFAKILGTTQSVVSRYEDPDYGQVTLQTLLDAASKLDIALVVRFASFSDFFRITSDYSSNMQRPESFNTKNLQDFFSYLDRETSPSIEKENQLIKTQIACPNDKIYRQRYSPTSPSVYYNQPIYNSAVQNQQEGQWSKSCN